MMKWELSADVPRKPMAGAMRLTRNVLRDAHTVIRALSLGAACLTMVSCGSLHNDFDPAGGGSKKDYETLLGRRGAEKEKEKSAEPPIPQFQSVLAAPSAPELADTRRVSIAVTETVPVRDILIELGRKAGVDLELDPRITSGVIMTATDRPFIDVIDRLCDLAELRYKFSNNVLSVTLDDPYMEQYHLDVLNISRTSSSEVSSSTDASSAAQSIGATGGGGGGTNKSSASVTAKSTADFWTDIALNVQNIIDGIHAHRTEASNIQASFVPQAAPAATAGAPAPVGPGAKEINAAKGLAARQDQVSSVLAEESGSGQGNTGTGGRAGGHNGAATPISASTPRPASSRCSLRKNSTRPSTAICAMCWPRSISRS
jgi:general secretion pathway protein D